MRWGRSLEPRKENKIHLETIMLPLSALTVYFAFCGVRPSEQRDVSSNGYHYCHLTAEGDRHGSFLIPKRTSVRCRSLVGSTARLIAHHGWKYVRARVSSVVPKRKNVSKRGPWRVKASIKWAWSPTFRTASVFQLVNSITSKQSSQKRLKYHFRYPLSSLSQANTASQAYQTVPSA